MGTGKAKQNTADRSNGAELSQKDRANQQVLNAYLSRLNIPKNWSVTLNGICKIAKGDNGNSTSSLLCTVPVLPTAIYNNIDTETEKVKLSYLYHGFWREYIADRNTISAQSNIVSLSNKGIPVDSTNAKLFVSYLNDVINNSLDTIEFSSSKSVLGWVDDGFMPYTSEITFDGEDYYRSIYKHIKSKGTVEQWAEFVAPLREKLPMRMMLAASFASPMLEKVGENPFVLHCFGKTGISKTVSLMVAMSVWGYSAIGGLTRNLNMTQNSMLSTAAFLNNLPFAGDELQTIKNRWDGYDRLIMSITEGIDRGRMSFDKISECRSWRCAFIFTGEEPCILPNSGGGVKNRVIQIECQDRIVEEGNPTANFIKNHYGTAAKPFLEEISGRDLQAEYTEIYNEIITECTDTTNKQAGAMAMLLLADRVSTELFFPQQAPLTFDDVRQYMFTDKEVDISERAYDFICDKISENSANFGQEAKTVWGKIDGYIASINKSVLEKLLRENGFDFDAIKRNWAEHGYLIKMDNAYRWTTRIGNVITSTIKIKLPDESRIEKQKETIARIKAEAEERQKNAEKEQNLFDTETSTLSADTDNRAKKSAESEKKFTKFSEKFRSR